MGRVEQPADRRDALDDEELVPLPAPAGGRVSQLEVVGQPGVRRIVDGHRGAQHAAVSRHRVADRRRPRQTRTGVPARVAVGPRRPGGRPDVRRPAADRPRRRLLGRPPSRLARRRRGRVRPAVPRTGVEPPHGHDVRPPAPRAAPHLVVDARRRARAAAGPRRDPDAAERPLRGGVRLDRVQLLPRRRRLGGVARRPAPAHDRQPDRGDGQRRRAPPVPAAARGAAGGPAPSTSAGATCS